MTRTLMSLFAVGAFLSVIAGPGCGGGGVGDPCTPEQEYDICFPGFSPMEVNVESKSFQCQTRLCLVNHFQGRVSCPFGQNTNMTQITASSGSPGCDPSCLTKGSGPNCGCCQEIGGQPITPFYAGQPTCAIPGAATVIGDGSAKLSEAFQVQVPVKPQLQERDANTSVYCSCRCANVDGQTNDGSVYCQCPSGYACTQLVTSIGVTEQGLTGGYCMKVNPDTTFMPQQLNSLPCAPGGTCH